MATFQDVVKHYLAQTEKQRGSQYNKEAVRCYLAATKLPELMAQKAGVKANVQVVLAPKTLQLAATFLLPHERQIYNLSKVFDILDKCKLQHEVRLENDGKESFNWSEFNSAELAALQQSAELAPGLVRVLAQSYSVAALKVFPEMLYPLETFFAEKKRPGFLKRLQSAVIINKVPEFALSNKKTLVYFHLGTFDDYGNVPLAAQMSVLMDLADDGVQAATVNAYRDHFKNLPPRIQLNIGYLKPLRYFAPSWRENKDVIELLERINGVEMYAKKPDMCKNAQRIYEACAELSDQAKHDLVANLLRIGFKKSEKTIELLSSEYLSLVDMGKQVNEIKPLNCTGPWIDVAKILPTLYVAWLRSEAQNLRRELAETSDTYSVSYRIATALLKWAKDENSSVQGLFSPRFFSLNHDLQNRPVEAIAEFLSYVEYSTVLKIDPSLLDFILRTKPSKPKRRSMSFADLQKIAQESISKLNATVDSEDAELVIPPSAKSKPAASKPAAGVKLERPRIEDEDDDEEDDAKKPSKPVAGSKPAAGVKLERPRIEDEDDDEDDDEENEVPPPPKPRVETEAERKRRLRREAAEREDNMSDSEYFGKMKRTHEEFEPTDFEPDDDVKLIEEALKNSSSNLAQKRKKLAEKRMKQAEEKLMRGSTDDVIQSVLEEALRKLR